MQRMLVALCLVLVSCASQKGSIQVTVLDKSTLSRLPNASIRIESTPLRKQTEKDGQCFIENLKPGTYALRVFFIGYYTIRFVNVTVVPDAITKLEAKLETEWGIGELETIDARTIQVIEKPK